MATTRPQRAAQARKPLSQSSLSHSLQLHVGCVNLIFSFCPHWSTSELKKEKAVICMTLSLARKWCFLTIDAGTRCWRQGCSERECLFCMHCHPSASSECFFVRFDSGGVCHFTLDVPLMQIHILSAVEKDRICLSFLRCHTLLERYHAIVYETEDLQVELPPRSCFNEILFILSEETPHGEQATCLRL